MKFIIIHMAHIFSPLFSVPSSSASFEADTSGCQETYLDTSYAPFQEPPVAPSQEVSHTDSQEQKCGFIALLGQPNAGKSTLINALMGYKVAAVSRKPHTTRFGIYGILKMQDSQIIFIDTPGFVQGYHSLLHSQMIRATRRSAKQGDARLLVIDAEEADISQPQPFLHSGPQEGHKPLMIALNKVDKVKKAALLPLVNFYQQWTQDIALISAKEALGLESITQWAQKVIPHGPWLFPQEDITQISQRLWAEEITREKLFESVHQEIPYHTLVVTEKWQETQKDLTIHHVILVEKERFRKWILGYQGQRIRQIGILARKEMQEHFGKPVHLFLWVKADGHLWKHLPTTL